MEGLSTGFPKTEKILGSPLDSLKEKIQKALACEMSLKGHLPLMPCSQAPKLCLLSTTFLLPVGRGYLC